MFCVWILVNLLIFEVLFFSRDKMREAAFTKGQKLISCHCLEDTTQAVFVLQIYCGLIGPREVVLFFIYK